MTTLDTNKKQLHSELDKYLQDSDGFLAYYPGMNVFSSSLYREQLKKAIALVKKQESDDLKSFELYLDTIINFDEMSSMAKIIFNSSIVPVSCDWVLHN